METINFDCNAERELIEKEKSGEIMHLFQKGKIDCNVELEIKNHMLKNSRIDVITDPISDLQFATDLTQFSTRLPSIKSDLFINFDLFEKLINRYSQQSYSTLKISFLQLEESHLKKIVVDEKDLEILKNFVGSLYALATFIDQQNKIHFTYLLFNLKNEYPFQINIENCCNNFILSSIGSSIKNASTDHYVPCSIAYELPKVKNYLDRMKKYLEGCLHKKIDKINFILCFGSKVHSKLGNIDSFYISTIPFDQNNQSFKNVFPYYDQGSLEP